MSVSQEALRTTALHCQRLMFSSEAVGIPRCPTCLKTIIYDPSAMWARIDSMVAGLPPGDFKTTIRCNDCNKVSMDIVLNALAMKCSHCGSYNTCRE
eukprot:gene25279-33809_t